MTTCTRLAFCAWLAACGSAPPEIEPPRPPVEAPCRTPVAGTGFPHTLLRLGCDARLEPGRARWAVARSVVTLDIDATTVGPRGEALVAAWPPLDQPPWLGHLVERIVILPGDRVRVEFEDRARDPARVFIDPRLAGIGEAVQDGDVRDAIDANEPDIMTRHDASIEYALSLGKQVELVAFDRLYLVAFAGTVELERALELAAAVGRDWIGWGAPRARRLPPVNWVEIIAQCASGRPVGAGAPPGVNRSGQVTGTPTVSYPEGDLPARQVAERLASAGLRTGPVAAVFTGLTGTSARLAVRASPADASAPSRSDVAAVARVHAGPVHPCSLYGEVVRELAGWGVAGGAGVGTLLLIGEAGAFAIREPGGHEP